MESAWNTSKMKVLNSRTLDENVPPLQIDLDDKRGRYLQPTTMSPRFQRYAENIDVSSPLARYLFTGSPLSGKVVAAGEAFTPPTFGASKYRTAKAQQYCGNSSGSSSFGSRGRISPSPLSSIENVEIASLMSPPMYRTPATGDDDVIVMDDILVRPVSGGKSGRSSSSSGRGSSSSSSTSKSVFKTEICRAWEESGNCRYNSKCQFAHGKEELHTGRLSTKSKSGAQTCSKSSIRAGSSTHGPSSRNVHQQNAAAEPDHEVTTSQPTSPEPNHTLTNSNTSNDWSPLDDGIEVVLPNGSDKAPSREEVDAYISSMGNSWTAKRRLPVFAALCKGD
ncbi:Zinc finger protein 36, C3H1 type 3 [Spatholobus suberectus]|nr:Zinc finger protein 36, C3H1 type 3 [Spatholobus suberectus]